MNVKKNEAGTLLPMMVTEGVTVHVIPSERHEYLMTTREVAAGYGTSMYVVQKAQLRHADELIEGKHLVKGRTICLPLPNAQPNQVYWTKRGIVRLGFFITSERARLFRDWAEELVIRQDEPHDLFGGPVAPTKMLSAKRRINRLTPDRLIDILSDVCLIENGELRERIATKLKGGYDYGN